MFFASFCITIAFAVFATANLKIKSWLTYIISLFLFSCSHIILVFQAAGFVAVLNQPTLFLLFQVVLAIGAISVWLLRKRPTLFCQFSHSKFSVSELKLFLRQNPLLSAYLLLVDICYAINAYLNYIVPPNNNDSLYLHMARVGHWMLGGSFDGIKTYYAYQLYYPYNAQGLIFWTVLFTGSDHLSGYIQYFALIFCLIVIYGFCRMLNLEKEQSIFAAAFWLSFPQVFFQSTTTQNDLTATAFTMGAIFLLFYGFKYSDLSAQLLSALSLGLAIGTKQTAFFIIPSLSIIILALLLKGKIKFSTIKYWLLSSLLAISLLGVSSYLRNYLVFSNPIGPGEEIKDFVGIQDDTPLYKAFALNSFRVAYQLIDTTGLPPIIEGYVFRGKANLAQPFFKSINMPLDSTQAWYSQSQVKFDYYRRPALQEDGVWFGLFAGIFLPFLMVYSLVRGIREKNWILMAIPLFVIIFHIMEFLIRPGWDFYLGRNYLIPVTLAAVLFGYLYQRKLGYQILTAIVILLSGYMIVNMVLNNRSKPLLGKDAIWNMDRFHKITLQTRFLRIPLDFVERKVPDGATIGLSDGTMEYLYFGEHFTRNVTAIQPISRMEDRSWLLENGVDYLLVRYSAVPQELNIPFAPLLRDSEWGLYRVE